MMNELEIISPTNSYFSVFFNEIQYRSYHRHNAFEICLLLRGKGKISTPEGAMSVASGDVWVMNPFQPHRYAGSRMLVLIVQIAPGFFAAGFPVIQNVIFRFTTINVFEAYTELFRSLMKLAELIYIKPQRYELKCSGLLNYMFDQLMEFLPYSIISESDKKAQKSRMRLVNEVITSIEKNYYHKLLLSDIAEELNLSVNYLSHVFKNCTGMSFQKYLAKIRCTQAYTLLQATDLSLFDISISSGFSDAKYFTKNFVEFYGISPGDMRKSLRDGGNWDQAVFGEFGAVDKSDTYITSENILSTNRSLKVIEYYNKQFVQN